MSFPQRPTPRLSAVLVASAFGLAFQAHAQDGPAASAPPAGTQAQAGDDAHVVLVTGTRRRTPVREVPMAVNAISAEELERRGAEQLRDYVESLPGVTLNGGGGRGMGQISIRGITVGGDINPPTSTYLDDIPYGGSDHNGAKLSLDLGALDLHHIEIYRGPQGTLYGANALGGVVKYVFNEPDVNQTSGYVRGELSSTRNGSLNYTASAVANVPLSPGVAALRVGAAHTRDAGHMDAVGPLPGERVDRSDATSYRIAALFTPNHDLSFKVTAMQQKLARDGNDATDYTMAGQPVQGEFRHLRYVPEPFDQTVRVGSFELDYDLRWARLNAVLSYQTSDNRVIDDASGAYVAAYSQLIPGIKAAWVDTTVNTRKKTAEVRLTSPRSDRFEWLAGVFANREDNDLFVLNDSTNANGPNLRLASVTMPATFREVAAFGDVTFYPLPALGLTLGARASRNKQHSSQTVESPLIPSAKDVPTEASDNSHTWLATARYTIAPKSSVYVRFATGYNPGGVNSAKLSLSGATLTVHPSYTANTLLSSEVGYKADLLDNRLSVEASLYRLDWKDLQVVSRDGTGGEIVNGGKARVNGAEFAATVRPADGWTIESSVAWIDGKTRDDIVELGARAGDRLPLSPKWAAALRAGREFTVGDHTAHAALAWRYVGERDSNFQHTAVDQAPAYKLPSYSTFAFNAGVELGAATVNVFVRNLADKRGQAAANTGYVPYGQPALVSLIEPRTVGVNVQYSF